MIDWASGYTSEWRVMKVDQNSWGNSQELHGVNSVTINRDATDDYPLLESASLTVDISATEDLDNGWYRIEMLARQGTDYERVEIATVFLTSNSGTIAKGRKTISVDGYSVLKPAADKVLTIGKHAPKGVNAAEFVASLLAECTPAPVVVEGSFVLNDYYVFPIGTPYIEAIWTLLDAGGFVIQIHGDGEIHILKKPTEPNFTISDTNADVLRPSVDYQNSFSEVPNRYIVWNNGKTYTATNNQADSRTSVQNAGRIVDLFDPDPIFVNGETMEQYAKRRLYEESITTDKYSYEREFVPDIYPFSRIKISSAIYDQPTAFAIEQQPNSTWAPDEFTGDFVVLGQTINCGHGVTIAEKVGMEIEEYRL